MNLENFITSNTGLIHFIASIAALLLGTFVLILPKGTSKHKVIGRSHALSMLLVLSTAFMIYGLFGNWGIFHWTAVISTLTILCGLPEYSLGWGCRIIDGNENISLRGNVGGRSWYLFILFLQKI